MSIITLLTDFGLKDGNVGVMKGVIWGIAPQAKIADLSHTINPQNIPEGALILARSTPYFPAGTIHVAVVDPGVGTSRRPIAARLGSQLYVLPDNGLVTQVLEQTERQGAAVQFVHLDRPRYWRAQVSHVFHGRDIFAPVAAHLAAGVPLLSLGTPVTEVVRLPLPQPELAGAGLRGEIIHIDHFGNLSTNFRQEHLAGRANPTFRLGQVEIRGLVRTFGERPAGDLIALFGSTGSLFVAVVNGSAAQRLGLKVGDPVEVTW